MYKASRIHGIEIVTTKETDDQEHRRISIYGVTFSMSELIEEPISPSTCVFSAIKATKCCCFVHQIQEKEN